MDTEFGSRWNIEIQMICQQYQKEIHEYWWLCHSRIFPNWHMFIKMGKLRSGTGSLDGRVDFSRSREVARCGSRPSQRSGVPSSSHSCLCRGLFVAQAPEPSKPNFRPAPAQCVLSIHDGCTKERNIQWPNPTRCQKEVFKKFYHWSLIF